MIHCNALIKQARTALIYSLLQSSTCKSIIKATKSSNSNKVLINYSKSKAARKGKDSTKSTIITTTNNK